MNKNIYILIGLLGMAQSLYAAPVKIALEETAELKSIQAVLFQSLKSYEENFRGRSGMPVTVEENGKSSKVVLKDENNRIECNSMLMKSRPPVTLYRCEFDLADLRFEWTHNTNSVPAILNEALRLHKSEYPDSPVVIRGRKAFARDGGNSIHTQSSSGEWTPAEQYQVWFSFEALDTPITTIENATLVCENSGVKYAFEGFDRRVWQSDAGENEGLEINVRDFQKTDLMTAYSWRVEGVIRMFDQKLELKLETQESSSRLEGQIITLQIWIKDPETNKYIKQQEPIRCKKID